MRMCILPGSIQADAPHAEAARQLITSHGLGHRGKVPHIAQCHRRWHTDGLQW